MQGVGWRSSAVVSVMGMLGQQYLQESADSKDFIDVVIWKLRLPFSELLRITIVVILPLGYSFGGCESPGCTFGY